MKRYSFKIKREVSYVEDVEAVVVAKSREDAERIAADIGDGKPPLWPEIERYGHTGSVPLSYELIETAMTHVE